jgi:3-phenylpropionate/trans-cinnamate dioxygenase ferredoxin reductase subunit|tara:strand:- start:318 stop:1541 length:1224 start_codon:yes stop_codon:yes gene_type:complete
MSKVIIIGGGHAGANVAFSLRKDGYEGEINILSNEDFLPYHRPPLSKEFLKKNIETEKLFFKPDSFYQEQNIIFHPDASVISIDTAAKEIKTHSSHFAFDYLVFATGGSPRLLPMTNADAKNLFYLRKIADVLEIHSQLDSIKDIVLIGGGYIGLEVASAMIELGVNVTILEAEERILKRVTSPELSAFYQSVHEAKGVKVICNARVSGLLAENQTINCVELESGKKIPTDAVLVGIGAIPNTQLAEDAGLDCSNGITTDQYCRTANPHILAAGDCANSFNTLLNQKIRLESVPNALSQAKVVASSIVGNELYNKELPWFWSDQYDLKLQMAGLSAGHDESIILGDIETAEFIVCYGKAGYLAAVDSVNQSKQFMLFKRALSNGFKLEMSLIKNKDFQPESIFSGSN